VSSALVADAVAASLIAMLVVGAVLLVAFGVYEKKYARYPLQPMRVLNKTFGEWQMKHKLIVSMLRDH
jgi:hypothetical protein